MFARSLPHFLSTYLCFNQRDRIYISDTMHLAPEQVPSPAGLLSGRKSGEENEMGNIIEWGASASSRCVKYDRMNPITHKNFHEERGMNRQRVFWQRECFDWIIRSESDLYEPIRLGRDWLKSKSIRL